MATNSYEPREWNYGQDITPDSLNHMEQGIKANSDAINTINNNLEQAQLLENGSMIRYLSYPKVFSSFGNASVNEVTLELPKGNYLIMIGEYGSGAFGVINALGTLGNSILSKIAGQDIIWNCLSVNNTTLTLNKESFTACYIAAILLAPIAPN